ncbi:MAG: hypothetical protein GXP14_13685 [Gammaproteobacteria bacterium]|nr:hypothetical protein [Gammaproteobacteria bacterium]
MKSKILIGGLSYVLLCLMTMSVAFAHEKTVIYGKSVVMGVQVMTEDGFIKPEPGITDENEILYNIPYSSNPDIVIEPVPLRQVPTLYMTDGVFGAVNPADIRTGEFTPVPVVIDEPISADNQMRGLAPAGTPNPITYGDWVNIGHSKLIVKVLNNGTTKVKMKVRGLLPNSLYTVWQFNLMGPPGPFAGIPNVLATNDKGNATLKRTLPYNLLETVRTLDLIYHSDHSVYGGTPSRINIFAGHDQHVQLQFNVQASQQ